MHSVLAVACPNSATSKLLSTEQRSRCYNAARRRSNQPNTHPLPVHIDGRAFPFLSSIFTTDAVANYSAPLGVLNGLSTIAATLEQALASFPGTKHLLGPQNVRICDSKKAISVAYYRAVHFLRQNGTVGPGDILGGDSVLYAYGQYQDT
ncbi:hypothetical protein PMIN07_006688 [Paraphaeosphaeria minitans]